MMAPMAPPEAPAPFDFDAFHRDELPQRLAAGHGALAAEGARGVPPIAFRVPGGAAYTYVPRADGVDVVPGEERAASVIELPPEFFAGLVEEFESPPGLLYGCIARCPRGDALLFVRWDPVLRAMWSGRPIFDPARADLRDRRGAPLDPARAFGEHDDPEDMAHFLRTAGYLLARGVFRPDEVERFRVAAERARAEARKGDKLSWWGKNADGEELLCRVLNAREQPELRDLPKDPRIARLVGLSDHDLQLRIRDGQQGVSIIFKNPGMTEGLGDLPWHRDCGMGGHAVMCPVLIASIFLWDATPESGELRVLPGSWSGACSFIDARHPKAPRGVGLAAAAGDVSLHYGDLMHAAPPPAGAGPYRASVVMGFAEEGVRPHRFRNSYNDVLLSRDDGQVEHLAHVARRR